MEIVWAALLGAIMACVIVVAALGVIAMLTMALVEAICFCSRQGDRGYRGKRTGVRPWV